MKCLGCFFDLDFDILALASGSMHNKSKREKDRIREGEREKLREGE